MSLTIAGACLPFACGLPGRNGVDLADLLEVHVNEFKQTMTVYEFVRNSDGFPLTDYKTMRAAEKVREIKLLSPCPK